MKKKRIFITGAFGFIGSNLVKNLQDDNELVCYDKDICKGIHIKNDFDILYHLAASTNTRETEDIEMYRNNILGFLKVLDFALKGKSKLIYASSLGALGLNGKGGPVFNAYSHSKRIIDEMVMTFFDKLPIVGLRFGNVFGPGELQKEKMASMITRWSSQIKSSQRPIAFKNEKALRDHIYVKDIVKGLKVAVGLKNGIYDLGSGKCVTFDKVLELVQEALESNLKPIYISNPYKKTYQKFTKARLNWGFKPDYTLKEGINDYLKHESF